MKFVYPSWLLTFVANVPNVSTIYVILEEEGCKVPPLKEPKRIMMSHECQDVWVIQFMCEKKCWKARLEKFIVWNAWFTHLSKARTWYWGQRPTLLNCSNLIFKPKLEGLHKSKKTPNTCSHILKEAQFKAWTTTHFIWTWGLISFFFFLPLPF